MKLEILEQREVLGKDFKIYGDKENPLFLAKDVAEWIEHSDRTKMLKGIDEEEKVKNIIPTLGGNQEMWFLTEDGLYEVLMQSRKPIAKAFKKEVKKILKQIRKTGGYIPVNENMSDSEIMARALLISQKTIEEKDKLLKAKDKELNSKNKFINQIAISENSLLVREVAKIASDASGLKIGEKSLWKMLREWKMIFNNSTEPYQKEINNGHFEVVTGTREAKGKVFTYHTTRVTGKGQVYIINKLLNKQEVKYN